jgi:hypothetical protein
MYGYLKPFFIIQIGSCCGVQAYPWPGGLRADWGHHLPHEELQAGLSRQRDD